MDQPRWELNKEEAQALARVIAQHVDAICEGQRHTAVVEAQREGAAAPHLVFLVTINPNFIAPLLEFAKHHPAAQLRTKQELAET
jgi:hypothetical protein